jgi:hypothetical protein
MLSIRLLHGFVAYCSIAMHFYIAILLYVSSNHLDVLVSSMI